MTKKYTKEEITKMADECYRRCWHCERYEPVYGSDHDSDYLFKYVSSGCYEARDLPWEKGKWCPFWGNKRSPKANILESLTWDDVDDGIDYGVRLTDEYDTVRQSILAANPEFAKKIEYCNNSNEQREQYFNATDNNAVLFDLGKINVFCETLRRYRFSKVDSRLLYPGANEWVRPLIVCFKPDTYKIVESFNENGDGEQISFACSPDKNYMLSKRLFSYDKNTQEMIARFEDAKTKREIAVYKHSIANLMQK